MRYYQGFNHPLTYFFDDELKEMNKLNLLLLLLCFNISVNAELKNNRFDRIYDIHGLNQNTVSSIHQDKSGFIWLGTPNGLFRYNGNEFKSFIHQPGEENTLINSSIQSIFEDANEHLWLVTSTGLSLYDLNTEKFITPKNFNKLIAPDERIKKIQSIDDKQLLILTTHKLHKVTIGEHYQLSSEVIKETEKSGVHYHSVNVNNGKLYLLNYNEIEVFQYNGEEYVKQYALKATDLHQNGFWSSTVDLVNDKLYITSKKKIFEFELNWEKIKLVNTLEIKAEEAAFKNASIKQVKIDQNGIVWVITHADGVFSYDTHTKKFNHYYNTVENSSISSNIINDILLDDSGTYWFATGHGSISILNPMKKPFHNISNNYYRPKSLSSNLINSIFIDKNQKLWVGHYGKGLNISNERFKLENAEQIDFESYFDNTSISSIKKIDDKVYISSSTGLYVTDEDHRNFDRIFPQTKHSIYHVDIVEKINNTLIIYAYGQFFLMDEQTKKVTKANSLIKNIDLLKNIMVIQILNDNDKGLYLGTNKGLFYLSFSDTFEVNKVTDNEEAEFYMSRIFVMHRSKSEKDVLWVGTFGDGLYKCKFKNGKVVEYELFSQKDGLPDNVVYSIVDGTDESLWISTDGGIAKIYPKSKQIKVYDVSDGLLADNFRRSAYFKMDDGTILMGNLRGITAFNPLDIKDDEIVPRPQILKLKIRNEEINPLMEYEGVTLLQKPIYKTDEIVIPYDLNQINLEFGAMQYNAKNGIQYSYRMLGVDKKWIQAGQNQQSANFVKLPSGEYTFELKASNSDGVESTEIKRLKITVLKPWYKTTFAYLVYTLLLAVVVVGVVFYLRYLFRLKQSILLEKKDKEHIKEINEAKLKFFTNISHELRTPLTLILSPLEKLTYDKKLPEDLKEYVENINTNGQRLLNLTNSLIDFRKIGEGEMKIYPVFHDVTPFVTKTAEAFHDYAKDKEIDYNIDVKHVPINGWIDKGTMERILFNLLSNAFKYTPKGGKVSFSIDKVEDELQLIVSDTGLGMDKDETEKIFDRFYRGDNEETLFGSSGIGLNLVQQLLKLHHGTIKVDSEKGKGSKFTVCIPLLHPEFDKSEGIIEEVENVITDDQNKAQIKGDKHKLLIVDDNVEILKMVKNLFHEEYEVHTAENGIDGLEVALKATPDVIILDVNMPKMNGYELAEKLKENVQTSHVPIIFLTAMSDLGSRQKALEKGGQLHIGKPFSPYLLELQINNIISQKDKEREILKKNIIMSADKEKVLTKDEKFLQDIKKILEEDYDNDEFTVEELSVKVNMSYIQFYRKFKAVTGITANEYLRMYRLEKASHLLSNDENITVREVMYNVGFNSQSYFTKAFKKEYGLTPAEFKKKKKEERTQMV